MKQNNGLLKDRLIEAIVSGELGVIEGRGIVFTLKEFKSVFMDIKTDYINSFLPAASIEPGRESMTQTKYLFPIRKEFIGCIRICLNTLIKFRAVPVHNVLPSPPFLMSHYTIFDEHGEVRLISRLNRVLHS